MRVLRYIPPFAKRIPREFKEVLDESGWREVEHLFGKRTSVNRRWVEHLGGKDYLQARKRERKRRAK
ncbi:hypothetical protein [Blastomonas sp. CCH9-A1]|uniref:hypothetical protein n=1 Tax=Blastomonas sp. CCH9-A1 TaxID=1768738 RepID=UPI000B28FB60|nr:hypothetical protein [Blastomonas sp. CCH9-A1]